MKIFKGKYLYLSLLLATLVLPLISAQASTFNPKNQKFDFGSKIVKAADSGNIDILQSLLEQGGNPNEKGKFEATALHRAAMNNNLPITKLLISKGANVDIVDFGGASPLHVAAREGSLEVLKHLLKNNADIDLKDKEGFTPLHRAVVSNKSAAAITLIEAGAEVNTESRMKNSPIIDAARKGNYKIVEELIAKGANKDAYNKKGYTAYDYAKKINSDRTLASLEKTKSQILRNRAVDKSPVIIVDSKANEAEIPAFLADKFEQEKKEIYHPVKEIDSLATVSLGKKIEDDIENENEVKTAVQEVSASELPNIGNAGSDAGETMLSTNQDPKINEPSVKIVPLNDVVPLNNSDDIPELEFTSNDLLLEEIGKNPKPALVAAKPIDDIKSSLSVNRTSMDNGYNYQNPNPEIEFNNPPKSIIPASVKVSSPRNKDVLIGDGFTPMSLVYKDNKVKNYNNIITSKVSKPLESPDFNSQNKQDTAYVVSQKNIEQNTSIPKSLKIKEALSSANKNFGMPSNIIAKNKSKNYISYPEFKSPTELKSAGFNRSVIKKIKKQEPIIMVRKLDEPIILNNQKFEKEISGYQPPKDPEYQYQELVENTAQPTKPSMQNSRSQKQGVLNNMSEFFSDNTYDYSSKYNIQDLESQRVKNLGLASTLSLGSQQNYQLQAQPEQAILSKTQVKKASLPKSLAIKAQPKFLINESNKPNKSAPTNNLKYNTSNKNNYVRISDQKPYKVDVKPIVIKRQSIVEPKIIPNQTPNKNIEKTLPELDVTYLEPSLELFDTLEMQKENIADKEVIVSGFNQSNIIKEETRSVAKNYNYLDPSKPQIFVRPIIDQETNLKNNLKNDIKTSEINTNPASKALDRNLPLSLRMKPSVQSKNYQRMFNDVVIKEKQQANNNINQQKIANSFTLPRLNNSDNLPGDIINSAPLPDVEIASMQTLQTPEIEEDIIFDELPPLDDNLTNLENRIENENPNLVDIQEKLEDSFNVDKANENKKTKGEIVKFDVRNDDSLNGFHAEIKAFETSKDAEKYYNEIASRFGVVHAYKIVRDKSGRYKVAIGKMPSQQESQKLCVIFKSEKTNCTVVDSPKGEIYSNKKVYSILGEFSSSVAASSYIKSREDIKLGKTEYNIARAGDTNIYLLQIGPVASGEEAKKICDNLRKKNQRCKVAVQ